MAKITIKGKIIRIIDTRTVIINLGTKDGITNDSYFNILGEPEEIIDPFTQDILGSVNIVKAKLKASQAYEKFTIATTSWISHSIKLNNPLSASLADIYETVEVDEGELRVDKSQIQPWKAKSELPVKIGDIITVEVNEELVRASKK
jgi:hypothetical protein